jgi:hypothetical protein
VQRVAPKLSLLLLNAFELMCLFCAPGTHDQKCMVVPFISTCYFARDATNTLCDIGFALQGLCFCVTCILGMGVPMTQDSIESWIKLHILSKLTCMVLIVVYVYMIDLVGYWLWAISFSLEFGKLPFVCSQFQSCCQN